jgi:ATP-binding cassette, subfamily A (ABC1), member 3
MASGWKIFSLLMYKNLIVRKRHWRLTIFLQALVPIGLFALLQAVRDFSVQSPVVVNENTYYSVETQDELMEKMNNDLNKVYYTPNNVHTRKIMESVRYCLRLLPDSKYKMEVEKYSVF